MRFSLIIMCLFFSVLGQTVSGDISNLKWLSGTWRGKASWGQPVDLIVSKLHRKRILASENVFKDSKNLVISSYEHFEIRQSKSSIELEIFPKNQKSLILKMTSISSKKVVFENQKHDFPKVWSFELLPDGKLKESASGEKNKVEILFMKVK